MRLLDIIMAMFRTAPAPIVQPPVKKRTRAKARKPREADLRNPKWVYTPALETDVSKTFAKFAPAALPVNVAAIKRSAAK